MIDVYPDEVGGDAVMGGYQLMIAADIFRGRYREGFETAKPVAPDTPLAYRFALPTANHVFLPGHRIMVQVQSSWFPLYDRNPQTFVPSIFWAKPADFRKAVLDWVDGGHRIDLFLSVHNTETGEYLEAPAAFRALGERARQLLVDRTTFNPTVPLRETPATAAAGRMTVAQGLFHDRKIPAMLMEQMIEYNGKLGRCPTASDRIEFGAGLVRALAESVRLAP